MIARGRQHGILSFTSYSTIAYSFSIIPEIVIGCGSSLRDCDGTRVPSLATVSLKGPLPRLNPVMSSIVNNQKIYNLFDSGYFYPIGANWLNDCCSILYQRPALAAYEINSKAILR